MKMAAAMTPVNAAAQGAKMSAPAQTATFLHYSGHNNQVKEVPFFL